MRTILPQLLICLVLLTRSLAAPPTDGLVSKTTHAAAYGPTNNVVTMDSAKDLPRYPAVEPKDAVATWQVKKGFHLEQAASEPEVRDPIAICFDERGRMFVCEMIDYSEMRDVSPHLGRISMLEDKDGDGRYESRQTFADNLPWPTGLTWANGGLYVGATPDIWRFQDKDGDGKAELREKIYTGFATGLKILNVQGLMNSFQWGQDNRIHVLAGGGNRGKIQCLKRPDLPDQELGGKDFWFDPLTHEFGLEGGGAQYGMSFDNYGRKFACSNSDHLQYWLYDDRYVTHNPYYDMPQARRSIAADGGAAEVFRISPDEPWRIIRTRWRVAGVVKGAVEGGGRVSGYFTGATGTTIYRGDAYGPEFVGNSFTGDAGGQLIHRKIIRYAEDGINLIGERPADEHGFEFAASKDTWVRVVNFANAPDGCLYVCDMYREVIEHPWSVPDEIKKHLDLNNGNDRGRIWRIVPDKGVERRGKPVALHQASTAELVKTLSHTNGWHRDTAQRLLYEKQDKSVVSELVSQALRVEASSSVIQSLQILNSKKQLDAALLAQALRHTDAQVRECALMLAAPFKNVPEVHQALAAFSKDSSPRVRFIYAMLLPQLVDVEAITAEQLKMVNAAAASPLMLSALLSGVGADSLPLLETMVRTKSTALEGPVGEALLNIIGQQKSDTAHGFATALLAAPDISVKFRQSAIKAFAAGLRRSGNSLSKVDTEGKLAAVFTQAAVTAENAKASENTRLEAIEILACATKDQAQTALSNCLATEQSEPIQIAAVTAFGEIAGSSANAGLLSAWAGLKGKARDAVLALLLGRDDGSVALLAAISAQAGPLPADLAVSQVLALAKHKNAKIAQSAALVLKSVIPQSRAEMVKRFQPSIVTKGDAKSGQQIYLARCIACHVAEGQGIEVGPNLVTVKTKGRDGLLTAILEPHKEVAAQYICYTVNTKDGQTLIGVISQDEANSMTLKMMGGALMTVPRSNIQGSFSSGQSLMPEGLEQGMSVQDMADLLSFIEAIK